VLLELPLVLVADDDDAMLDDGPAHSFPQHVEP